MTFVLTGLVALTALGAGVWRWWRNSRAPVRLGLSVQPYALGGPDPIMDVVLPEKLLQLDIRNVSGGPIMLTAVRMVLRGESGEHPVFREDLGEDWILRKDIAVGDAVLVKCSSQNEDVLPSIASIKVYVSGYKPVTLGARAVRRGIASLQSHRG